MVELLHSIIHTLYSNPVEEASLESLQRLASSGEIRDYDWLTDESGNECSLYDALFNIMSIFMADKSGSEAIDSLEIKFWDIWKNVLTYPEFKNEIAATNSRISTVFLEQIREKILASITFVRVIPSSNDPKSIKPFAFYMHNRSLFLHWLYANRSDLRPCMRNHIGELLLFKGVVNSRLDGGDRYRHVSDLLKLLGSIIEGLSIPLSQPNRLIMRNILLPLHSPNEMVEWRDQIPVLQDYHESLVNCCVKLINKDRSGTENYLVNISQSLFVDCFRGVLATWPAAREANTAKEVLLLHELESLLQDASSEEYLLIREQWLERWVYCIAKDSINIRTKQRALQVFRNERILELCIRNSSILENDSTSESNSFLATMIPSIYCRGELSWNPTVNKMAGLALGKLKKIDPILFDKHVQRHLHDILTIKEPVASATLRKPNGVQANTSSINTSMPAPLPRRRLPPSTEPNAPIPMKPVRSIQSIGTWRPSQGEAPPLTVTGVAPWASAAQASDNRLALLQSKNLLPTSEVLSFSEPLSNNHVLDSFIEKCLPPSDEEKYRGTALDWKTQQAALSPTLLPNLKFHDLVFGKLLGSGTFSTVKYARSIEKDLPRSLWPEYAVKIMSEASLQEHAYLKSAIREMATLQLFSHPGVARMVSSFRYNRAAYLVLEYASGGDLHTHVIACGALSHSQTRFITGEAAAAVSWIHEQGFSINDLKPENILVTELGHIKLTDFGAARAVTDEAKVKLRESRRALGNLRDGDWKERNEITSSFQNLDHEDDSWVDDDRLEGTPGYLPPEVLQRLVPPSQKSDAWALGCLLLFCLYGRPRYFGDSDDVLKQLFQDFPDLQYYTESRPLSGKVGWEHKDEDKWDSIPAISGSDPINVRARDLIDCLLHVDHTRRISVINAVRHPYLTMGALHCLAEQGIDNEVVDPTAFYSQQPVPLPQIQSKISSSEDQQWARRQFSVLWAPMPVDYSDASQVALKRIKVGSGILPPYGFSSIEETSLESSYPFFK